MKVAFADFKFTDHGKKFLVSGCNLPGAAIEDLRNAVYVQLSRLKHRRRLPSPKQQREKLAKTRKLAIRLKNELHTMPSVLKMDLAFAGFLSPTHLDMEITKLTQAIEKIPKKSGQAGNKVLDQDELVLAIARVLLTHAVTPKKMGTQFQETVETIFSEIGEDTKSAKRAITNSWEKIEDLIRQTDDPEEGN